MLATNNTRERRIAFALSTSTKYDYFIVFVLTDQWRAQATGYGGDPNVKTPNVDALASRSINFANAVSVCPVCTPYRASLMTGRYPLSTGMFMNDLYLPGDELCMGEIFKEAGYETAYIGKWHLDGHGRDVFIPKNRALPHRIRIGLLQFYNRGRSPFFICPASGIG